MHRWEFFEAFGSHDNMTTQVFYQGPRLRMFDLFFQGLGAKVVPDTADRDRALFGAMVDPQGDKFDKEYKLQGKILSIKKANGEISPFLAGKNVVLKAVTDTQSSPTKRSAKATFFTPQLGNGEVAEPDKPTEKQRPGRDRSRDYHVSMARDARDEHKVQGMQGAFQQSELREVDRFPEHFGHSHEASPVPTSAMAQDLRQAGAHLDSEMPSAPDLPGVVEVNMVEKLDTAEEAENRVPHQPSTGTSEEEHQHQVPSRDLEALTGSKSSCRPSTAESGWEKNLVRIILLLEENSKFKQTAVRSRRRFFSNVFLACRLAFWMVILAGPVIVWPVAEFFNSWGARSSKYMASYGMAMSNFCFLLSPSVGMGIRYALEGIIGTLLALANMLLLNQAFGSYMKGGAYVTREAFTDPALDQVIYRSDWLPLCNLGNGARFITTNSTQAFLEQCFMNVHWSSMTDGGVRSAIVLVDLTLFTAAFLGFGFGGSTRIYALTYVTFWLMLFVNPGSDAFIEDPSDPWTQAIMTCIGCFLAVVGQLVPCPNTALRAATKRGTELTMMVAAILECLPFAPRQEIRAPFEFLGRTLQSTHDWRDRQGKDFTQRNHFVLSISFTLS